MVSMATQNLIIKNRDVSTVHHFSDAIKITKSKLRNTPFIQYADIGICIFTNANEIDRNEGKSYNNIS